MEMQHIQAVEYGIMIPFKHRKGSPLGVTLASLSPHDFVAYALGRSCKDTDIRSIRIHLDILGRPYRQDRVLGAYGCQFEQSWLEHLDFFRVSY